MKIQSGLKALERSKLEEALDEIVHGLVKMFDEKIYSITLYGSYARGEQDEESDVDIALILYKPIEGEDRKKRTRFMSEMDLKYDALFSMVDIDKNNYDEWEDYLPFYRNVRDEGVVLWKKTGG